MCGIAGVVMRRGQRPDEAMLDRMAGALAHRGPDAQGVSVGRGASAHVGLAHRRLSVLDVAGGAQPMHDIDDRVHVVFNGQVYNHLALRAQLSAELGARAAFRSDHSDTEVLVVGAKAWGAAVFSRASGMLSAGVVDDERALLWLARDRMGKKPLYVAGPAFFDGTATAPRLAWASELAALEALPGARRVVDETALAQYLGCDYVPDPACIYRGVLKVPPGHTLTLRLDRDVPDDVDGLRALLTPHDVPRLHGLPRPPTEALRAAAVRQALDDATATRLVADVPVGVFLSGGIDSSVVAALASRHSSSLLTFSVAFREQSYDESVHARAVAKRLGTRHHEELLDEGALLDAVPALAATLSEPFGDASVVSTWLLSRFARRHVTVALGGDGGDELFYGYPTFVVDAVRARLARYLPLSRLGAAVAPLLAAAHALPVSHADLSVDYKLQRLLDGVAEPRVLRRHQRYLTGATPGSLRALLSPAARAACARDPLAFLDDVEGLARAQGAQSDLEIAAYGYLRTYLAAGVLQKVDRASMAHGLEVRAPFLDPRVVDLALSLPAADHLHGLQPKAVLKAAAAGLVDDAILHRQKKGFGMPVAAFLCGPLRPLMEELLSPRALHDDGLLDVAAVRVLVDEHLARRRNHRKILWSLLMFRLWRTRAGAPA